MKRFNILVKKGTYVKINGDWYRVKSINENRLTIQVEGLVGSFQRGHVDHFSNKAKKIDVCIEVAE